MEYDKETGELRPKIRTFTEGASSKAFQCHEWQKISRSIDGGLGKTV